MFKNVFTLLLIIVAFTACKRSGTAYVKGTVFEADTNIPVKGEKVYVTDTKYGSTHHEIIGEAITDENGYYYISYYKKPTHKYILRCEESDNYIPRDFKGIENRKFAYTLEMYPKH